MTKIKNTDKTCENCQHWNRNHSDSDLGSDWGQCKSPIVAILEGGALNTKILFSCKEWEAITPETPKTPEEKLHDKRRLIILRRMKEDPDAASKVIMAALNPRLSVAIRDHNASYYLNHSIMLFLNPEEKRAFTDQD